VIPITAPLPLMVCRRFAFSPGTPFFFFPLEFEPSSPFHTTRRYRCVPRWVLPFIGESLFRFSNSTPSGLAYFCPFYSDNQRWNVKCFPSFQTPPLHLPPRSLRCDSSKVTRFFQTVCSFPFSGLVFLTPTQDPWILFPPSPRFIPTFTPTFVFVVSQLVFSGTLTEREFSLEINPRLKLAWSLTRKVPLLLPVLQSDLSDPRYLRPIDMSAQPPSPRRIESLCVPRAPVLLS